MVFCYTTKSRLQHAFALRSPIVRQSCLSLIMLDATYAVSYVRMLTQVVSLIFVQMQMLASLVYSLEKSALVYLSLARVVLVPLLALCALPGPRATALDDAWTMFLSLALGLSNGVLGSVPMIVAPSKVPHHYRELTGRCYHPSLLLYAIEK